MRWLINLIRVYLLGKPKLLELKAFTEVAIPEPFDVEIVEEQPVKSHFQILLEDSLREAAEEKFKEEEKLLSDQNLPKYFSKCIKYLVTHLHDDKNTFIIMQASHAGVNESVFDTFSKIFAQASSQIGLEVEVNPSYMVVRKPSLIKLLEAKDMPKIDIEEKVRKMLHTGIYR